ncbi:MAG: GNAT family N-acetyltransferase [Candidatus Moraniibacteriota bacterium]|nr:MAG: GNAT family N-acetyltransferase [Candidatus Moranbacteria bacterium]
MHSESNLSKKETIHQNVPVPEETTPQTIQGTRKDDTDLKLEKETEQRLFSSEQVIDSIEKRVEELESSEFWYSGELPEFGIPFLDKNWAAFISRIQNSGRIWVFNELIQEIYWRIKWIVNNKSETESALDDEDSYDEEPVIATFTSESQMDIHRELNAYFQFDPKTASADDRIFLTNLLFHISESSKEINDWDDDPRWEIDRRILEYSDNNFPRHISSYIDGVIGADCKSFFEQLVLERISESIDSGDFHYYHGPFSSFEGRLSEDSLYRQKGGADTPPFSSRTDADGNDYSVKVLMQDRFVADYLNDDMFELFKQEADGTYTESSIRAMLSESGLTEDILTDTFITRYRSLMDLKIRSTLEEKLGFSMAKLSSANQVTFLNFLSTTDAQGFESFQEFILRHDPDDRVAICSSYLAFQNEPDFSYIIERVCQHREIGLPLIRHVYELIGNAEQIRMYLNTEFTGNYDKKIIAKIHGSLIRKAYNLLLKYDAEIADLETIQEIEHGSQMLADIDTEEDGFADTGMASMGINHRLPIPSYERERVKVARNVEQECSAADLSQTLLLNTFKSLKEEGTKVSLEDFQSSECPTVSGRKLSPLEAAHMRSLYADSMTGYPTETRERLLTEFDNHIQDEQSTFSLLRHKGEIVGSLCFTEDQPGQKYISAVTLDPRFQKAYIGEAMIDEAFKREARENILGADCVAEKSVSARYIENGFVGVRSWDDKGDLILDIVRDDRRNEQYFKTKAMTQEEIVKLAPLGKIGSAKVEVVSNPQEHSFARCNEGFVLTRYFRDTQTKKWYLVYEPMPVSPQAKKAQRSTEAATA